MARGRASADDSDQLVLWSLGEEPSEPAGEAPALAGGVASALQAVPEEVRGSGEWVSES